MGMNVQPTLCGAITAEDCIIHARERGNDCVIIASKTSSHEGLLRLALAHRLPTFCEKPMVTSVKEALDIEKLWGFADHPPFLCDFVHLWGVGFDYAWPRFRALNGNVLDGAGTRIPMPEFGAVFGGNIQRKDLHPVWDYGCHGIALALMLNVDLHGLKCEPCECENEWTLYNDHAKIHVSAHPADSVLPHKYARAWLGDLFALEDGVWNFPRAKAERTYKYAEQPPLQRALKWFLNTSDGAWKSHGHNRDGMWLPRRVTEVLESVCSPESPYK